MNMIRFANQYPNVLDRFFDNESNDVKTNKIYNHRSTMPSVNVVESEDAFLIEVAAPGYKKEDFNIELDDDVLVLSTEIEKEKELKEGEKFTKREFSYQSFKRSFNLPELVEKDQINAKYENGILNVSIPKKEEAKPAPTRNIKVA